MSGKLLKAGEVAQRLGISRSFVYQLMKTGEILTVHIGRNRRVKHSDLERFISENTHGGSGIINVFQEQKAQDSEATVDNPYGEVSGQVKGLASR